MWASTAFISAKKIMNQVKFLPSWALVKHHAFSIKTHGIVSQPRYKGMCKQCMLTWIAMYKFWLIDSCTNLLQRCWPIKGDYIPNLKKIVSAPRYELRISLFGVHAYSSARVKPPCREFRLSSLWFKQSQVTLIDS